MACPGPVWRPRRDQGPSAQRFHLAQEMRDQVSDSGAARLLGEQFTRGDKKLGWTLTDLPQTPDDALLPRRQSPRLGARLVC